MLFNSIEFALFLPIVFILYWFVLYKNLKIQNFFLIVVSYIFYGWWDWRFLILILISSGIDYSLGLALGRSQDNKKRKLLVILSLVANLGMLGFFKYFNFFIESFVDAFSFFGYHLEASRLDIVLPVGISFYTFQTLSYTIDVYRREMKPTKDLIAFFAYVAFFPQLVAGPIEKATRFLPQFYTKRNFDFDKAKDGLRQMLWGFFKKIVIADNCALFVNEYFQNPGDYSGSTLFLGAILFYFQLYCDFTAYADIAIGTGRLFGFDLMKNFDFPEFARTPAEFWRKWHISLTSWLNIYVLRPLGGFRGSKWFRAKNVFIIFLLIGIWHEANWTFVIFGILSALYVIPEFLYPFKLRFRQKMVAKGKLFPSMKEFWSIIITYNLIMISGIIFRAPNISVFWDYLGGMFSSTLFSMPTSLPVGISLYAIMFFVCFMVIVHWFQRDKEHGLECIQDFIPRPIRWTLYYLLILAIVFFARTQEDFVYFQF